MPAINLYAYRVLYRYAISCTTCTEFISYENNGDARGGNYVHGFHVYQDICTPTTGECLSCQTEDSNAFDPYAVVIRKSVNVTGHVPRKISAACSLFIQRGKGALNKRRLNGRKANTDDNYYVKIILAKFIFGSLVMIC